MTAIYVLLVLLVTMLVLQLQFYMTLLYSYSRIPSYMNGDLNDGHSIISNESPATYYWSLLLMLMVDMIPTIVNDLSLTILP